MDFDSVLKKRYSARKFAKREINFKYLPQICEAATLAPTAGNIFTLKFIIVSDEKKKALIARATDQDFIFDAPYLIVVCSSQEQAERAYGKQGKDYVRQQAGAAIQNMLLKITSLGLCSCWVGSFKESPIRFILRIPEKIGVEAILPVGVSSKALSEKSPRKINLGAVTFFDKWNQKEQKPERYVREDSQEVK